MGRESIRRKGVADSRRTSNNERSHRLHCRVRQRVWFQHPKAPHDPPRVHNDVREREYAQTGVLNFFPKIDSRPAIAFDVKELIGRSGREMSYGGGLWSG